MHPKDYLHDCTELLALAMKFEQPLDSLIGDFLSRSRRAGARERDSMASVIYTVMRQRYRCEHLAQTGPGPEMRRLALLGFALSHGGGALDQPSPDAARPTWWTDYLAPALTPEEATWLAQAVAQDPTQLPPAAQLNWPDWLVQRVQPLLGPALPALCQALETTAPVDLRVNLEKAKRSAVLDQLRAAGVMAEPTAYSPWGLRLQERVKLAQLPEYQQGLVEIQDEGSQLIALLTEAKRNETVVDFCAGGGGKTLALGAMMRNTGRLYAYDTSNKRLEGLQPRLVKSGLTQVHTLVIADEADSRLARMQAKVNRVLVDAPCSGTGTLRRNPALKWRLTPARVAELVQLQHRILAAAAVLVASKGRLVYATCSLLQEENEAIAQAFSKDHTGFMPVSAQTILTRQKIEGAASLCSSDGLYLRLWPHQHASDGFFAAVWERKD